MRLGPIVWKSIISFIITSLCLIIIFNKRFSLLPEEYCLNLGLDLQGGAHLLLEVDFESYISDQFSIISDSLRKVLRKNKILYRGLSFSSKGILLSLINEDQGKLRRILKNDFSGIEVVFDGKKSLISFNETKREDLHQKLIEQSIEILRMRIDSEGTKEPLIQKQGENFILLQAPGDEDPEKLKNLVGKTAKLSFHMVHRDLTINYMGNNVALPQDKIFVSSSNQKQFAVIDKKPTLLGDLLVDAQAGFNQAQPVVLFEFNQLGAKLFGELTQNNIRNQIAIVLDGNLLSAPVVNEAILGGKGSIQGNFTVEEANELSTLLRAGALPAPLTIIEERTVGPSLGADSIEAGKKAAIIAFVSVLIFMFWSYGILGLFANIALISTMTYIFAILSIFQATLTLPGIAGIILTIGMAVDANVLIYEHIKEEIKQGISSSFAVTKGFRSAFATIMDSNITTLVAAFLLYIFGVGTIRGFAVTLSIGIISSMFSAIWLTKLFIDIWMLKNGRQIKL